MKQLIVTILGVALLVGLGIWAWTEFGGEVTPNGDQTSITSFEECVAAGNPVMESYPPQCRTSDGRTFVQDIGNELEVRDLIRLSSPRPQTTISSPLVIEGEARGTWYFEASFPIRLLDANGQVIAEHYATAEGEWMTENFVPFEATLEFATPATDTGVLVLEKDNPSGLPENANALRVPVRFSRTSQTMSLNVYFGSETLAQDETICTEVFPVQRVVPRSESVARAALEALIKGPTAAEKSEGYYTSLPDADIEINSLTIQNGVARVDFSGELDENVGGSCRVSAIHAQIEETLKQFPTVQSIVISVEGNVEEALQP